VLLIPPLFDQFEQLSCWLQAALHFFLNFSYTTAAIMLHVASYYWLAGPLVKSLNRSASIII
jgi:hypothetical protein